MYRRTRYRSRSSITHTFRQDLGGQLFHGLDAFPGTEAGGRRAVDLGRTEKVKMGNSLRFRLPARLHQGAQRHHLPAFLANIQTIDILGLAR